MNPIEQLKIMANSSYVILKDGMTKKEIEKLKRAAPKNTLSKEVEEVLSFSSGFKIERGFLNEIQFNNFGDFGFEELIEFNLTITHDGSGNYWIQEINQKGEWGKIFYVCHDPAVIIKQANNLSEFLSQLHEYFLKGEKSFFSEVYKKISFTIYSGKGKLLEQKEAVASKDEKLSNFAKEYNEDWFIADLRNAKNGEGFLLEANYKETIRFEDELIWALKKRKGFWTRIKGIFNSKV